MQSGDYK